jgi:hypothetical protein
MKMKYISEVSKRLGDVVKTAYEVARLVPELGVTVAKDPRTAPMATMAVLYVVASGCASICASIEQRHPTAKACQVAAQTENYLETTVPNIEGMLKDGKIDANEFNDLLNGQAYLKGKGKTLDDELKAAKARKDETASGALDDVKAEHAQASGIVDNLVNIAKTDGKAKAYIGFNMVSGKGLLPKAWDRYAVEIPYNEAAEKFGNPTEWTKVPADIIHYFADKLTDPVAKEAVKYFLQKGGMDPSSVHVKTEFAGAGLSEEQLNATQAAVKAFKEAFMKEKEAEKPAEPAKEPTE